MTREASVSRTTRETSITISLKLDGRGDYDNQTGVGFLDHMLDLFARHGRFDLSIKAEGDLHIDDHHTVEDVGIVLGQAFAQALGDKAGINRYGHAYVPMDEALARCVIDLSGRAYLVFEATFDRPMVGDLSTEMVEHFWYSFAQEARMNLHLHVLYGNNDHHRIEALFKAAARALRMAVHQNPGETEIPSTKGAL